MKKIGIIFGMETTFPPALVDKINSMDEPGIQAELAASGVDIGAAEELPVEDEFVPEAEPVVEAAAEPVAEPIAEEQPGA